MSAPTAPRGRACAALGDMTLTIFRTEEAFADGTVGTVVGVDGAPRTGELFSVPEGPSGAPDGLWGGRLFDEVVIEDVVAPHDATGWFAGQRLLRRVEGAENIDMSRCVRADATFADCASLEAIDVSRWRTGRLESAACMFDGCASLECLDVSRWDTGRLEDATGMFSGCRGLVVMDVTGWDTSRLSYAPRMFMNCDALERLDVSRWDVRALADARDMFCNCSRLATLDVSRWDARSLARASWMFADCASLEAVDVSRWDARSLADATGMFSGCPAGAGASLTRRGRDGAERDER